MAGHRLHPLPGPVITFAQGFGALIGIDYDLVVAVFSALLMFLGLMMLREALKAIKPDSERPI